MKRPTAKKARKARPWTREDILALNKLTREGVRTTAIARKLKRTYNATRQKAASLGVKLAGSQRPAKRGKTK
jgi:hypothetical protein